jgi:hypothetical protein
MVVLAATACTRKTPAPPAPPVSADSSVSRVEWPLLDLVLVPDTSHGILLLAGPNIHTENWMKGSQIVSLAVEPVTLLQWASAALALLREPVATEKTAAERYKITPALRGHWGEFLVLARRMDRAGEFQFIASDTASKVQWKTLAGPEHVNQLLQTIEDVVARAPTLRPWNDSTLVADPDTGVVAAFQLSVPPPKYPADLGQAGQPGRVWAQYIVGLEGRVEPGSIRILLTDHREFAGEAVAALMQARFRPATRNGQNVRQRVFQAIVFRTK